MMENDADFAQMLNMCYGVSGDGLGYVDVFKALTLSLSLNLSISLALS